MADASICRIKICGEAGDGIISTGEILMRIAVRMGYYASAVRTVPSNIRGGYSQSLVTIAREPLVALVDEGDVLLLLNEDAFLRDTAHITDSFPIIFTESGVFASRECCSRRTALVSAGMKIITLSVQDFSREAGGRGVVRTLGALGILCHLLGIDKEIALLILRERYGAKGADTVERNHAIFDKGYSVAPQYIPAGYHPFLDGNTTLQTEQVVILDGNQAIALGALGAGCTFYASYPITPATSIGETLAVYMSGYGGCTYQAEDEIAALGSAIGASFSGVKAMTATSGPGLSLMQEWMGYASMVELPVVVVDVQRVGPSTGMPTKHSQDDLAAAVYGGHGEGQRIVIAPLSVEDCFHATVAAFNCAERYQCPVLLLSDASLAAAKNVIEKKNLVVSDCVKRKSPTRCNHTNGVEEPFRRFAFGESYVNQLPSPGNAGYTYCATGVEHGEDGVPVATPEIRSRQMKRRFRKLDDLEATFDLPVVWDREPEGHRYDAAVCAWGFTVAATMAAIAILRGRGIHLVGLYPRLLFPVCREAVRQWSELASCRIVVEANYTGQYNALIKTVVPIDTVSLTVYHGEPFTPREITKGIVRILEKGCGTI